MAEKKGRKIPKSLINFQRQLVEFQKSTFDSTFDAIAGFQDRQEEMLNDMLDKGKLLPDEGKQIIEAWVKTFKKGREDFRDAVETSYNLVDDYFDRLDEGTEEDDDEESE